MEKYLYYWVDYKRWIFHALVGNNRRFSRWHLWRRSLRRPPERPLKCNNLFPIPIHQSKEQRRLPAAQIALLSSSSVPSSISNEKLTVEKE